MLTPRRCRGSGPVGGLDAHRVHQDSPSLGSPMPGPGAVPMPWPPMRQPCQGLPSSLFEAGFLLTEDTKIYAGWSRHWEIA